MARLALEHALPPGWVDEVFEAHRRRQYDKVNHTEPAVLRAELLLHEVRVVLDEKRRVQRIGFALVVVAAAQHLAAAPGGVRLILEGRTPELDLAREGIIADAERR